MGRHPEVPARNSAPRVGPEFGILRSPVGDRTGTRRYHDSRFAKAPHLGKLGQFLGRAPAVRAELHLTERAMHPANRHQHEQENKREPAFTDAGQITQRSDVSRRGKERGSTWNTW